ncbi:MAG TPA: chromosome segregation protein SMC [Chloroflexota bacterium]|nr:chromosome segregation protein SMC [Chloroflexota bacterium]
MPDSRLRNLELTGFKTFARRTEVILPGGVTGIVGPNGSGKSNLADALRWVLGEQSLQHIRSKKTEDVIFAGGANRAPMGAAEVTLTLDNTSGWIPLDFSEVTISRRAYRSGDNEYFINGSRVRLRDVIDLRNRAGFGQSSYSVIGQGLVDSVLSQRPEERRALIEEAAGIRHYQAKRDQTLDQLAATRLNLVRVQDIVAEIEPRVESLRRQSDKARQYGELTEQLRTLQIRWYAARQRQLQRQTGEAEGLLAEGQRALANAAEELRALEAQSAALDADRATTEQSLARENQRAGELRRQREQLQGQVNLATDKLQFMQQQRQDVERELADLSQARAKLAEHKQQLAASIEELRRAETQAASELEAAERDAAGRSGRARELDQRLQQARDALSNASSACSQLRREGEQLDERRHDLQRQAEQHDEDMSRKQGLVRALAEKQTSLQREVQQLRAEEEQLSGEMEELRLRAGTAASASAEKQARLDQLRRAHDELATRLSLLQELQTNLEGLAEGARRLLKSGRPGVLGSLAQGLKVKPPYERAIAAALGHKLDAVLVEGEVYALDILGGADVAEATLLLPSPDPTWTASAEEGEALSPAEDYPHPPVGDGIAPATSALASEHSALGRLLAGTLVVDDLAQALAQARNGWRAVTLSGDVVEPDGTITRRGVSAGEAILKRQQALEELAERLAISEQETAGAAQEHQQLVDESAGLSARLKDLEEESRRRANVRQQRAGQMRDLGQQVQAAQAQIDWLASLKDQLGQQLQALDLRRTALIAELDQAAEQIPELEAAVTARLAEAAELRQADEVETARIGELRLKRGVTSQQFQHAQVQLRDLDQQIGNAERQLAARQRRADEHGGTLGQLQSEIDVAAAELTRVARQMEGQDQLLPPLRNRLATNIEELRGVRSKQTEAQEQHSEMDKRSYRLAFDSQRKREEVESLATSLLEELQLTPDLLPEPRPDLPEPSKRDVEALKARLAGLGPVNPGALEEFREVQERHQFLTTQKADLEQAAQQLQAVIADLEELTKRQFLETFELVAQEFERFFGLMFNGGQVQMHLTDPDNMNATGIDILAQPPGKRLQALPLLSGGERALIATALLFAILTAKPVPFCLLDEVDAALDEANVKRFCQALKSVAEQTQFVVITHNRETMAIADALYGVSMSQDGVSRLVSLRLPREDRWAAESPEPAAVHAAAR